MASTKDFIIIWKLSDVLKKRNKYKIKKIDSIPIDTQFKINNENSILVTDSKSIEVTTKRQHWILIITQFT